MPVSDRLLDSPLTGPLNRKPYSLPERRVAKTAHTVRIAVDRANIAAAVCNQIVNAPYSLGTAEDLTATIKPVKTPAHASWPNKATSAIARRCLPQVQASLDEFGWLYILVTNAGIGSPAGGC
uniref:Uncharacterized protein MLCB33.10 n=1 Tax=Mycobacterium leprae TaxID=1769 RepID=O05561_MYCLR|nr:unknown [Mycobacterium leprae]